MRSGCLDQFADLWPLVAGEVVHDDDISGLEFGNQHFVDIGFKSIPVDRPVENPWGDEAAYCERAGEGGCLPVSVRHSDPEPLTARAAAAPPRHVGGGPGFVDEDQPLRIEIELILEPLLAARQDVGTVLFAGMRRLFLSVIL